MAKITILDNGPYLVEGDIELLDSQGRPFGLGARTKIALCRCGHSQNKPFCDGAHKSAGFESKVEAKDLPASSS